VQVTQMLGKVLQEDGFDPQEFAQYFAGWKALGPAFEFADFYFGKDGYFNQPRRAGRLVLRHVHLPPENSSLDAARWALAAKRQGKKTSDTFLIYAFDPLHGFLLIDIVKEPNGHLVAMMATADNASGTFISPAWTARAARRYLTTPLPRASWTLPPPASCWARGWGSGLTSLELFVSKIDCQRLCSKRWQLLKA